MNDVLIAAAVVSAIGALCAIMLVVAAKFFGVKEDEKYNKIRECLPGANCGACGYAGCDGYAKSLSEGNETKTNLCIPGGDGVSKNISDVLGVEFEDVIERVATIHCYGDCEHTSSKMDYVGIHSCAAAKMMFGGDGKCVFGCIGLGDCVSVCPNEAICISKGIAHIDTRKCSGCGMCASVCPRGIIEVLPDVEKVLVTCHNTEKGAQVRNKCTNGCIGCKKCEKACETGAITVVDNLARIDYSKCIKCDSCAKSCPVGCIVVSNFSGMFRYKK